MANISQHAKTRTQQRGLKEADVEFVLTHGTPVQDGYVFSKKDKQLLQKQAKLLLRLSERLTGVFVAESCDGTVKTTFRPTKSQLRNALLS